MVPDLPSLAAHLHALPAAPWRARLDNLELGILLLTQPWLAGEGLRRAELERQVGRLAVRLPLGPIYFQRVKRAVARLVEIGALRALGEGRTQRFDLAPEGFAALVLNLRVLEADPTLDGTEFEFKRSLVALWSLVLDRLGEGADGEAEIAEPPAIAAFFDAVEALRIDGRPVVTEEGLRQALDVLQLLATQREAVERRLAEVRSAGEPHFAPGPDPWDSFRVTTRPEPPVGYRFDALRQAEAGGTEADELLAASPAAASLVRGLALETLPALVRESAILRYESYLDYLEGLARLHAGTLRRVPLGAIRTLFSGSRS